MSSITNYGIKVSIQIKPIYNLDQLFANNRDEKFEKSNFIKTKNE